MQERETKFGFSVASLGPREALLEYLGLFYGMGKLAGPFVRTRAVDVVTEVAPGFRDLMLAGKVYETAEWRRGSPRAAGRPRYDLVVADAPPTGQIVPFLRAPYAFAEMIRVGRPGRQARTIGGFLRRRARVVLVTTPEELPVAETLEAHAAIADLGVPVGPVVVNRVLPPALPRGTARAFDALTGERLAELLSSAGPAVGRRAAAAALDVTRHHRRAEALQRAQVRRLGDLPRVEVPHLFSHDFGPAQIAELSAHVESVR
jgi:anion-transporting  ArsA/GET3 family ATPase